MLPLKDLKVVELGQNLSAPFAAEILAGLGANVVKIERPKGDDCRGWGPPFPRGMSADFNTVNRSKASVELDLKIPENVDWLRDYLKDADILIHNMRAGAMEKMGLSAEDLHKINPGLIFCSLSAFGHKGPLKDKLGYEISVQAFSGLWSVNGWEKGPTSRVGVQVLDLGTGVWAALGCIAAVLERAQTGKGVVVAASLYETGLSWLMIHAAAYSASGQLPIRSRGSRQKVVVYDVFEAKDGEELLIAASNDRLFAKLAAALGHPEWPEDDRYRENAGRLEHKDYLLSETAAIIRTATVAEWTERLEAAGVPCSPINNLEQVLNHPHTSALGMYEPLSDDPLRLVGIPISFDGVRPVADQGAPSLGDANETLLGAGKAGGKQEAEPHVRRRQAKASSQ